MTITIYCNPACNIGTFAKKDGKVVPTRKTA
jgi:hypothetical protein